MSINEDDINEQFIATAVASLKRVEPPSDFDFKVRARIARGRPAKRRSFLFPTWAYGAAPAAAAVLVGGYFFSGGVNSAGDTAGSVVASAVPQVSAPSTDQPIAPAPTVASDQNIASLPEKPSERPPRLVSDRAVSPANRRNEKPAGGSFDAAIRGSETITSGRGMNANSVVTTGSSTAANKTSSTTSSLPGMGIRVAGNTVTAVLPGSAAAAAGVKAGDLIETVTGNTITIRRDGKVMTVTVSPR